MKWTARWSQQSQLRQSLLPERTPPGSCSKCAPCVGQHVVQAPGHLNGRWPDRLGCIPESWPADAPLLVLLALLASAEGLSDLTHRQQQMLSGLRTQHASAGRQSCKRHLGNGLRVLQGQAHSAAQPERSQHLHSSAGLRQPGRHTPQAGRAVEQQLLAGQTAASS